jgi:hypothetical protein
LKEASNGLGAIKNNRSAVTFSVFKNEQIRLHRACPLLHQGAQFIFCDGDLAE